MLDGVTVFAVSSIFALLSGAALALVCRSLPAALQPSARDWMIGTLLLALSLACFAWMRFGGAVWVRLLGNVFMFFGVAFYWRSIRRQFALPASAIVFLVAGAGAVASVLFLIVLPHFAMRIALITLLGAVPLIGVAYTLWRQLQKQMFASAWVLFALFIGAISSLFIRAAFLLSSASRSEALVESKQVVVTFAPLLLTALPAVGTVVFVLLCIERLAGEAYRSTPNTR